MVYTDGILRGGWEVKIFCLSWHLCAFCETCGKFVIMHWGHSVAGGVWWEWHVISNRSALKMYVRNRWSPIHIFHGFASKLHILHASGNAVQWVFSYRRCDKPNNFRFMKSWEKYVASFDPGLNYVGFKSVKAVRKWCVIRAHRRCLETVPSKLNVAL